MASATMQQTTTTKGAGMTNQSKLIDIASIEPEEVKKARLKELEEKEAREEQELLAKCRAEAQREQAAQEESASSVGRSIRPKNLKAYRDQYRQDCVLHGKQGISTGFKFLDNQFLLYPGIILLGGMPGVGKSSLAIQLANQLAEAERKVLYISLEQSERTLTSKSLSCYLKSKHKSVSWIKLDRNKLTKEEQLDIRRLENSYYDTIGEYLTIWHYSQCKPWQIECDIREVQGADEMPPIVIIDYLQKLMPNVPTNGAPRERVEAALLELGAVQRAFDCILIGICSLSREGYRENKRPSLADLKETGQLEYDADRVLMLYRSNNQTVLESMKDKEGGTWTVNLKMDGTTNYFSEGNNGIGTAHSYSR